MVKLLQKYNIKQVLIFLLVLFASTSIINITLAVIYIKKTHNFELYIKNYYSLSTKILEQHNSYRDALIMSENKFFIEFSEDKIQNIRLIINEINNSKKTEQLNITNEVTMIKEDFDDYFEYLNKIFKLNNEIYNNELGIEQGRISVQENIISDDDFRKKGYLTHFELIQKTENNLFNDIINFDDFENNYKNIEKSIKNIDTSNVYSRYVLSKFSNKITEYKNILISKYIRQKEIGLNDEEGLRNKINEKYFFVSSKNNELIIIVEERQNMKINKSILTWLIFTITILVLLFVIAVFVINNIYKTLESVNQNLENLSQGKIKNQVIIHNKVNLLGIFEKIEKIENELNFKNKLILRIKNHNRSNHYKPISDKDIIGNNLIELKEELEKRIEESQKLLEHEDKQKFITEGLTIIGKIMRQNTNNINMLASKSLLGMLEYLNSPQGAIYIYKRFENKEDHLELSAAYAYGKEKNRVRKIKLNEGLVGAVAVEKTHMLLNTLPENYIHLDIGYGSIIPKSLIIVPLMIDNKVYGIIEIANLEDFSNTQVEFLLRLSDEIATTISYVQINEKTAQLLEGGNKQAIDFKEEKEELKRKTEELENNILQTNTENEELNLKILKKEKIIKEKVSNLLSIKNDLEQKNNFIEVLNTDLKNKKQNVKNFKEEILSLKDQILKIKAQIKK